MKPVHSQIHLIRNIFITLFPTGFWVGLFFAFLTILRSGHPNWLTYLFLNSILFILFLKIVIPIHELGHILAARIVGGTPRRIVLGTGHKVMEQVVGGVKIVLNSQLYSGLAYAAFDDLVEIKPKLFLYISGGILANILFACLIFPFLDPINLWNRNVNPAAVFFISNLYCCGISIVPFTFQYHGITHFSDGLQLLKIPHYQASDLVDLNSVNELLDAYDLFESKKYQKALEAYENYASKVDEAGLVMYNLGLLYLKIGDFAKGNAVFDSLIDQIDEKPFESHKSLIYGGKAWAGLIAGDVKSADMYSELAQVLEPDNEYYRGTRALVLVEKGSFGESNNMALANFESRFPNSQTIEAAVCLAIAQRELGNKKESDKYVKFVYTNQEILDVDDLTVYRRLQKKYGLDFFNS